VTKEIRGGVCGRESLEHIEMKGEIAAIELSSKSDRRGLDRGRLRIEGAMVKDTALLELDGRTELSTRPTRSPRNRSVALALVLAAPVLVAIWFIPWFVSQDGPIYLYNAHILSSLSRGGAFYESAYRVRDSFISYMATFRLLSWLMAVISPRAADRLIMTLASIGFACSIIWARWRVRGWDSMTMIIPLVMVISFSKLWLYGLYGFLLGASLFPIALGLWWHWRERLSLKRASILAVLIFLSYLFHVISAGLIIFALLVLAVTTPGLDRRRRSLWTLGAVLPTVLCAIKFSLLAPGARSEPLRWIGLNEPFSPVAWIKYLQSADFISISFKSIFAGIVAMPTDFPFIDKPANSYAILSPLHWMAIGFLLVCLAMMRGRTKGLRLLESKFRGWVVIAVVLVAAGLFGPSGFGQGSLLRERFLLLGVISIVPLIKVDGRQGAARLGGLLLLGAVLIQTAFIYDYALRASRIAGEVMSAGSHIGAEGRLGMIVPDAQTHYLLNPLPNIVCQLGLERDNIVWNNYGPAYYYFPISFSGNEGSERWQQIDLLNKTLWSGNAQPIAALNPQVWANTFGPLMTDTDTLVVWGRAPWLDSIDASVFGFQEQFESSNLRVMRRSGQPVGVK
jgi:hypothetical protein